MAVTCSLVDVNRHFTRPVANGVQVGALRAVGIYEISNANMVSRLIRVRHYRSYALPLLNRRGWKQIIIIIII